MLNVKKHSHSVKISNVTGEYIEEMAYYSTTVAAGKLFNGKDKDMLMRYWVVIILCVRDKQFPCDKCNEQFPDIESLYQHKAKAEA